MVRRYEFFSRIFSTPSIFRSLNQHDIHTVVASLNAALNSPVLNYAFFSIPYGWHTFRYYLYCVVVNSSLAFLFRLVSGDRVPPFLYIYLTFTSVLFSTYFYKIPFFKHRDERDGQVETYGIDPWMKFPKAGFSSIKQ